MSRTEHPRRGSILFTRDLVGRGAHYEPKTPHSKRTLRRKARRMADRLEAAGLDEADASHEDAQESDGGWNDGDEVDPTCHEELPQDE